MQTMANWSTIYFIQKEQQPLSSLAVFHAVVLSDFLNFWMGAQERAFGEGGGANTISHPI